MRDFVISQNDDARHDPDAYSDLATGMMRFIPTVIASSLTRSIVRIARILYPRPKPVASPLRMDVSFSRNRNRSAAQENRKRASFMHRCCLVALTRQVCYSQSLLLSLCH